jgi:uncharacterized protein
VRNWCNGGCPKDRFAVSRDGQAGHNYLCPGLELFFMHVGPTLNVMAQLLRQRHAPAEIMQLIAAEDTRKGRNAPCPCKSGLGFGDCHGKELPADSTAPRDKTIPLQVEPPHARAPADERVATE